MRALSIHSLPNELLVAIAVAGQENRVADLYRPGQWRSGSTTSKCEWIWSRLSQRFRGVIVGAPDLWTLIETDFSGERSIEILKLYLERSRERQISVTLSQPPGSNMLDDGDLEERVTGGIIPQINRIRWLRIILGPTDWDPEMLAPFRDVAVPCLQHLEIIFRNDMQTTGALFLSGAPRLSCLKMAGALLRLPVPVWAATLTHLEYSGPNIHNLAAITAQCPFLAHLHLRVAYVAPDATRFHVPTLSSLHISIPDGAADYLELLVDLFDSPALTELIVYGSDGAQIALLLSLKTLPHSSFPSLTSLTFLTDSCPCETWDTNRPFYPISCPPGVFPVLSHLTLINQCYTEHLIQEMDVSFEGVRDAVEGAVSSKRQRGEPLPEVRLARAPEFLEDWNEDISFDAEMSW
ncbi:hypothetical protein DFH08DRAFT_954078 [Mycena albidolilacea]|uniref:Uncharacterized protein n=1 Tax=Mycena albidolilacea TaxID=1033008 RepID=A0AAD7AER0_9AGAR|nr:hypothetical protein DFH08DRAFT_954078 [Mycena albidolilacea]